MQPLEPSAKRRVMNTESASTVLSDELDWAPPIRKNGNRRRVGEKLHQIDKVTDLADDASAAFTASCIQCSFGMRPALTR